MIRSVVSVATGPYVKGLDRLTEHLAAVSEDYVIFRDKLPPGSPTHQEKPYAFKAWALKAAMDQGYTTLLWADACILPIRSLEPLWERIERDGYWISNNGFSNYEWTADSAYPDLFSLLVNVFDNYGSNRMKAAREINRSIPHVVATSFGLSLAHPIGREIFHEYFRLARTGAFCGPWINSNHPDCTRPADGSRQAPCGTPDVRGHRHDQTALSVIAWRLGCKLTNAPEIFSYPGGEREETILLADGNYA